MGFFLIAQKTQAKQRLEMVFIVLSANLLENKIPPITY